MDFDEVAVRSTVDEVVAAIRNIPRSEAEFPQSSWPSACCEIAACTIAAILEDRGLGEWLMVEGHRGGQQNGHFWLVFPGKDGEDFFSIDATLHQFPRLSKTPFVGFGSSPARAWFDQRTKTTGVWDWPYLGAEGRGGYVPTIRLVRASLAEAQR